MTSSPVDTTQMIPHFVVSSCKSTKVWYPSVVSKLGIQIDEYVNIELITGLGPKGPHVLKSLDVLKRSSTPP